MAKEARGEGRMKERQRLYLALFVLLGIIVVFTLYMWLPLLFGKTIILKTIPIDPFDVFRGQYIAIRYEISALPVVPGVKEGDKVYVQLMENQSGLWQYVGASVQKPSGDFIRGTVTYTLGQQMNLEYGIEQYFFERNAEFNTSNMSVEAKVTGSGQSKIVQLLHDGKPVEITYSASK
jgi:uncharacterized membrane-anchored protein